MTLERSFDISSRRRHGSPAPAGLSIRAPSSYGRRAFDRDVGPDIATITAATLASHEDQRDHHPRPDRRPAFRAVLARACTGRSEGISIVGLARRSPGRDAARSPSLSARTGRSRAPAGHRAAVERGRRLRSAPDPSRACARPRIELAGRRRDRPAAWRPSAFSRSIMLMIDVSSTPCELADLGLAARGRSGATGDFDGDRMDRHRPEAEVVVLVIVVGARIVDLGPGPLACRIAEVVVVVVAAPLVGRPARLAAARRRARAPTSAEPVAVRAARQRFVELARGLVARVGRRARAPSA